MIDVMGVMIKFKSRCVNYAVAKAANRAKRGNRGATTFKSFAKTPKKLCWISSATDAQ